MQVQTVNPFFSFPGPADTGFLPASNVAGTGSATSGKQPSPVDAASVVTPVSSGSASVSDQQQLALQLLQSQSTSYDQPSNRNLRAVDAYRQVDEAPKREELSNILGVDLYA
ncbi:hypothetical protein ACFSJ3_18985 [Corallincola platygyrae]|uniref:Uncharacterized protein n=1 Tax=Corallincola platygyrae TaxID=1193278 RepID=A0ABW4XRT8_9GAMM